MTLKISQATLRRLYAMITGSDTSSSLQGLSNLPAELIAAIPTTLVANHPNAPLNVINTGFPAGSADIIAPQTPTTFFTLNNAALTTGDNIEYTPTGSLSAYISFLSIQTTTAAANNIIIADGAGTSKSKFILYQPTASGAGVPTVPNIFYFSTPLKCSTNINVNVGANSNWTITCTGWTQ